MNLYKITYKHYDSDDLYETYISESSESNAKRYLQHSNNGIKVAIIRISLILN